MEPAFVFWYFRHVHLVTSFVMYSRVKRPFLFVRIEEVMHLWVALSKLLSLKLLYEIV